jgi:hypothetical protein
MQFAEVSAVLTYFAFVIAGILICAVIALHLGNIGGKR